MRKGFRVVVSSPHKSLKNNIDWVQASRKIEDRGRIVSRKPSEGWISKRKKWSPLLLINQVCCYMTLSHGQYWLFFGWVIWPKLGQWIIPFPPFDFFSLFIICFRLKKKELVRYFSTGFGHKKQYLDAVIVHVSTVWLKLVFSKREAWSQRTRTYGDKWHRASRHYLRSSLDFPFSPCCYFSPLGSVSTQASP